MCLRSTRFKLEKRPLTFVGYIYTRFLNILRFWNSYTFYSQGAWTVCKKTNIFHLEIGGTTDSTIIVAGASVKRSHTDVADGAMFFTSK